MTNFHGGVYQCPTPVRNCSLAEWPANFIALAKIFYSYKQSFNVESDIGKKIPIHQGTTIISQPLNTLIEFYRNI